MPVERPSRPTTTVPRPAEDAERLGELHDEVGIQPVADDSAQAAKY